MESFIAIAWVGLLLLVAVLARRSIAWSLDSPVLRAAVRRRRLGNFFWIGLPVVLAGSVWITAVLGGYQLNAANLLFGSVAFVIGATGLLFCQLVREELRDVFSSLMAGKSIRLRRLRPWNRSPCDRRSLPETTCRAVRHCTAAHRSCCPGIVIHPKRPVDWRRIHQRH